MDYAAQSDAPALPGSAGIVQEANERWKACKEWQGVSDDRSREDIKFANADARNAWQWDRAIYDGRTGADMPCLTINNTRTHNDLIINELSKNGYGIKVRPTGGKASYESAQVMQSIIRRIENISKASTQYRKVAEQQVDGGIGYIVIETAYTNNRSFSQDIYLKASRDPTAVYLDPWIKEPDGSDANFGFEFERMPRKEFNRKYPKWKNKVGSQPLDSSFLDWINDKEIVLVKYYRKNGKPDTLVSWKDEAGTEHEKLASEIKKESSEELYDKLIEDIENSVIDGQTREVTDDKVEWFLIAGDVIIDRGKWAGKYIPICRCVGRELVIDATLDRKGHTRPLIDAQRMLNYNASQAVQYVAGQTKTQWMAPSRATEGQEQWKSQNINTFNVLFWNDVDDEATSPETQKVESPKRIDPPAPSPAYAAGMQDAERHMMMVSGQFQAQMGENDTQSAASGKAINARKEQGDISTYHFIEHRGDMLRFIGTQLLDLIPKILDTERALHIEDEDGERRWIQISPNQQDAVRELQHEKEDEEAIQIAFNPKIGEYECVSDPGPDYATKRQEAWDAMTMVLQQNMQLAGVIGDLLFRNGDFDGADDIATRLQKEIKATKPYLFDDEANPQLTTLQQQNQRLVALNGELMQKLGEKQLALKGKEEKRDIDAFNADTQRMKAMIEAMAKVMLTPQQKAQFEHEIGLAADQHVYSTIAAANEAEIDQQADPDGQGGDDQSAAAGQPQGGGELPPIDGARQAKDGLWYVPDVGRPGKFMQVMR